MRHTSPRSPSPVKRTLRHVLAGALTACALLAPTPHAAAASFTDSGVPFIAAGHYPFTNAMLSHDGTAAVVGNEYKLYWLHNGSWEAQSGVSTIVISGDGTKMVDYDSSSDTSTILPYRSTAPARPIYGARINAFSYDGSRAAADSGPTAPVPPNLGMSFAQNHPIIFTFTEGASVSVMDLAAIASGSPPARWGNTLISANGRVATSVGMDIGYDPVVSARWNDTSGAGAGTWEHSVFGLIGSNNTPFYPVALSADGSVMAGNSVNTVNDAQGKPLQITHQSYRWTAQGAGTGAINWGGAGTYTQLDPLPNTTNAQVGGISADGKVIVGTAWVDTPATHRAFYYADATGMKSLTEVLENLNVSMGSMQLRSALAISGDGSTIVGVTGTGTGYIARLGNTSAGVITIDDLQKSVSTMRNAPMAASGMMRQTTNTLSSALQQSAPAAPAGLGGGAGGSGGAGGAGGAGGTGGSDNASGVSSGDNGVGHLRAWLVGTAVSDRELSGDDQGAQGGAGLSWIFPNGVSVGGGIFYGKRTIEGDYDSRQIVDDAGVGLFANYAPETYGLRLSGGVVYQLLDLDLKRGYANGAGTAASSATTEGNSITALAQAGWVFPIVEKLTAQPFVSYSWSQLHLGGYDESGGPFDASFSAANETVNKTRNGVELNYDLTDTVSLWTWGAWNHRFESHGMAMGGFAPGLGSFNLGREKVDQDWFDTGVGVRWQATQDFGTFLKLGSAFDNKNSGEPDLSISLGFTWDM